MESTVEKLRKLFVEILYLKNDTIEYCQKEEYLKEFNLIVNSINLRSKKLMESICDINERLDEILYDLY